MLKKLCMQSGRHLHSIADHTGRVTCLVKAGQQVLSSGVDRSIYAYHAEVCGTPTAGGGVGCASVGVPRCSLTGHLTQRLSAIPDSLRRF